MALELVRGFSRKSFVSKRLWKTIKGLKEVGTRLGLSTEQENGSGLLEEDPHSSAALAMAGLAGHEITGFDTAILGANGAGAEGTGASPMNGFQMSCEMTSLFEAALAHSGGAAAAPHTPSAGLSNGIGGAGPGFGMVDAEGLGSVIGSDVFGGDEELYRQLRDLF